MQANETRGEFLISLDGMDHTMRPTYQAIMAFEAETGKSLITLAMAAADGNLSMREMTTIAAECIRAYGAAEKDRSHSLVRDDNVARYIAEIGALHAIKPIQRMLLMAATGGVDAEGKAKALAETTGTTTEPMSPQPGDGAE